MVFRSGVHYDGVEFGKRVLLGGITVTGSFHQFYRRKVRMMDPKMIVVWGCEDILSASIVFLLAAKKDWKVVSTSCKEDLDAMIQAGETPQPEIVIINQGRQNDQNNFPLQLFQDQPAIRVIMVSLEDNMVEVYSKVKIMVQQAADLITVINNEL